MNKDAPIEESHLLTERVRDLTVTMGAVEFGVAPVELFRDGEDNFADNRVTYPSTGYAPAILLPAASSVVVVAVRIPDGVLSSNLEPIDTTYAFGNFGYVHLNRLLNTITYDVARMLENCGWCALPLGACGAARCDRQSYEDGTTIGPLHGIFNLKRAAILSGIGRRTRSGLVATPHHGTRVRIGAIITTAPLVSRRVLNGTPCPPRCRICIDACPMNAITTEGHVNHVKCFSDKGRRGATDPEILDEMTRAFPPPGSSSSYLPHEHAAIDGIGNRVCRVACMALCPLWKAR